MELNNKPSDEKISWKGKAPFSERFDDIYFSPENGLAESEYVFLKHNHLEERWKNIENDPFVIAEFGFGTGLNFLASCKLWETVFGNTSKKKLHFISFEKYPLEKVFLHDAHQHFPELDSYSQRLLQSYPKRLNGFHRLSFTENIFLTLIFDDAIDAIEKINSENMAGVDAWFLDGFSPEKNPALWSEALFKKMMPLCKKGTSLATFTCAGHVRRKLENVGFECTKVKGYGSKREMLTGTFNSDKYTNSNFGIAEKPWLKKPFTFALNTKQEIAVIGAGLAGAWTARKLSEKGFNVSVFEASSSVASGASGNSRGATYFKLETQFGKTLTTSHLFYLHAYLYSIRELNRYFPNQPDIWQASGLIQLYLDEKNTTAFEIKNGMNEVAQLVSQAEVIRFSKINQSSGGLFFPDAGSINPGLLCKELLNQHNITVHLNQTIGKLEYDAAKKHWDLYSQDSVFLGNFSAVILANSFNANTYRQTEQLPLFKVRGQSTQIKASQNSALLETVICAKGYLTPAFNGLHTIGSTFDPRNEDTSILDSDNNTNLNYLKEYTPDFYESLGKVSVESAKAALRCQSPDMLPILGQLCDFDSFMKTYAKIAKGNLHSTFSFAEHLPYLYINTAHASRGLISTPYCAEILVNDICNEPLACEKIVKEALSPSRFYYRKLKRGAV